MKTSIHIKKRNWLHPIQLPKPKVGNFLLLVGFLLFSFSTWSQTGPGGETTNLKLWFKADSGVTQTSGTLSAWNEASNNASVTETVNGNPQFNSTGINFNPYISFDGTGDQVLTNSHLDLNGIDKGSMFIVYATTTSNQDAIFGVTNAAELDMEFQIRPGGVLGLNDSGAAVYVKTTGAVNDGAFRIASATRNSANWKLFSNADAGYTTTSGSINNFGSQSFGISPLTGYMFTGNIAEVIVFNADVTSARPKIESYLAMKYGITLDQTSDQDYVSSDGTVVWDASEHTGFNRDLVFIGQDDGSSLDQKISKSINSGSGSAAPWVTLATTVNFEAANSDAGRTSLEDGNFYGIGNNNGTAEFEATFNGVADARMNQIWKVDKTGSATGFYIAIPNTGPTKYFTTSGIKAIVISSDQSFDTSDTMVALSETAARFFAYINPSDGDYFTFANVPITLSGISNSNLVENTAYTSSTPSVSPSGVSVTYALSGDDSGNFTVNSTTGVISMAAKDFENPEDNGTNNTYQVTLTATDAGGNSGSLNLTVTVTDVNEAPTDISVSSLTMDENTTSIGTFTTTDPDGDTSFTYTKVSGAGSEDNDKFSISGNALSFVSAPDYENPTDTGATAANNTYTVRVQVADGDNATYQKSLTITVNNVNEAPTNVSLSSASINENSTTVGTFTTTDPDGETSFTYTIVSGAGSEDNAKFSISGNTLSFASAPDYENPTDTGATAANNTYTVRVQVADGSNATYQKSFTITVNEINEAPTNVSLSSATIAENSTSVGTFSTTDPDGDTSFTYTIVSGAGSEDNAKFSISGNALSFVSAPDYENPTDTGATAANNTYTVRVQVADGDNATYQKSFTISVTDVNETANFNLTGISDSSVAENANYTSTAYSLTGEAPIGGATYSLVGADKSFFTLDTSAKTVSLSASKNFENPQDENSDNIYEVGVKIVDGSSNEAELTWKVTITNVNESVTLSLTGLSNGTVDENSVYTSSAYTLGGPPNGTVTYSLIGEDKDLFTHNAAAKTISMTAKDYENPSDTGSDNIYNVGLKAVDGDTNEVEVSWTVTVNNVAESASLTLGGIANGTVDENQAYESAAYTLTGSPIGAVTYSLTGTDKDKFSLNTGTKKISMTAKDYESPTDADTNNVYEVGLRAEDTDGNEANLSWTVTVNNVAESSNLTLTGITNSNLAENTAYSSTAYTLGGTPSGSVTYELVGADKTLFTLNESTKMVSMMAKDFEAPTDNNSDNVYEVGIKATDGDSNTVSLTWTVTITNEVESASLSLSGIANSSLNENTAYTSANYSLTGTPIGTVTYTLTGNDKDLFAINTANKEITMAAKDFESPSDSNNDNVYEIGLYVVDNDGNNANMIWTVTVNNVTESTSFTINAIADATVMENTVYNSPVPTITGSPIGSLTYSLQGADSDDFTINASTGVVTMSNPDFESPKDADTNNVYEVGIVATDTDGNTANISWSLTITNVNEVSSIVIAAIEDVSLPENDNYQSGTPTISGTPIGMVTYSVTGTDATMFTVNSSTGVVTFNAQNFEDPLDANKDNIYEVSLTATDSDNNSDTEEWKLTITDVKEIRELSLAAYESATIEENNVYTSAAAALTGTPIGNLVYSVEGADASQFTINSVTGIVSMAAKDYESPADADTNNIYEVTIKAKDDDENMATATLKVTVTDDPDDVQVDPGIEDVVEKITGDEPISIDDLKKITGLTGLNPDYEEAYNNAIKANKDKLSDPPTLAEIQTIIDQVNAEQSNPKVTPTTFVGLTMNGERSKWVIPDLDKYPNNTVYIYNVWGKKVFEQRSYQNDWDGFYSTNSEPLPSGSYLYQIDLNNDGSIDQEGWIYLAK